MRLLGKHVYNPPKNHNTISQNPYRFSYLKNSDFPKKSSDDQLSIAFAIQDRLRKLNRRGLKIVN